MILILTPVLLVVGVAMWVAEGARSGAWGGAAVVVSFLIVGSCLITALIVAWVLWATGSWGVLHW